MLRNVRASSVLVACTGPRRYNSSARTMLYPLLVAKSAGATDGAAKTPSFRAA